MIVFASKNTMYLTGGKKMDAVRQDRIRIKINLVFVCSIHKKANFVIIMPMRPICFMWIALIGYFISFDLIDLKILENRTSRQFIRFDTVDHLYSVFIKIGRPSGSNGRTWNMISSKFNDEDTN